MNDTASDSRWKLGDWHIPTVVAVAFWFASAGSVAYYTYTAFKETSDGDYGLNVNPPGYSGTPTSIAATGIDVAAIGIGEAVQGLGKGNNKPKEKKRRNNSTFQPSPDAQSRGIFS